LTTLASIRKISVFLQYSSSYVFSAFLKICYDSMKDYPNVEFITFERSLIFWSITTVNKRMIRLNITEKSISSFSLYSMHYFQILNYREAYLPDP
jgi:uncharacterized pyridoxamine 5'-phosphate oxidase family protein